MVVAVFSSLVPQLVSKPFRDRRYLLWVNLACVHLLNPLPENFIHRTYILAILLSMAVSNHPPPWILVTIAGLTLMKSPALTLSFTGSIVLFGRGR